MPTRRQALLAASATAIAGAASPSVPATAQPRRGGQPTFVFVHGAQGSSASWGPFLETFAAYGHRAVAVDLPGHGAQARFPVSYQAPQDDVAFATEPSAMAAITLDDYVNHVLDIVHQLARYGPVILVGMSLGGATIGRVGSLVPDLVSHLVYIAGFCLVKLRSVLAVLQTPEASTRINTPHVGDPVALLALRTNWRTANLDFLTTAKAAFFADGTDEQFRAVINACEPDESLQVLAVEAPVTLPAWGRIPRTYIRFGADRSMPPALVDRMITEADQATAQAGLSHRFDVHTIHGASHLGGILLHRPDVAHILHALA